MQRYHDILEQTMITATCRRLGIDASWDKAGEMVAEFMKALKTSQVGFDEACFDWYGGEAAHQRAKTSARALIYQARDFAKAADMLALAPTDPEAQPDHIYFQNDHPMHLRIDQVESIWELIAQAEDWSRLNDALAQIHTMSDAYGIRQQAPDGILLSSVIRPS